MNIITGVICSMAGAAVGIGGYLLIVEMRNGPRLMPASHISAYEKWCGEAKNGTTHYNSQKHITGCTVPPRSK